MLEAGDAEQLREAIEHARRSVLDAEGLESAETVYEDVRQLVVPTGKEPSPKSCNPRPAGVNATRGPRGSIALVMEGQSSPGKTTSVGSSVVERKSYQG